MDGASEERTPDTGQRAARDGIVRSARESSVALGVNERTIRRAIAAGKLRATKRAGVYWISDVDLARYDALYRRHPTHPAPHPAYLQLLPPATTTERAAMRAQPPLPRALTSLVGRERALAALSALVQRTDVSLVTITGPGGVGKTRLALATITDLVDLFPDGVWYVPLASILDPKLIIPAISQALGIRESESSTLHQRLAAALRGQTLLVLDNAEHLLEAGPALSELLAMTQGLTMLVTSRVRLRLTCEYEFPLPPLDLPLEDRSYAIDVLGEIATVRLFYERAKMVSPEFQLTDENAAIVAEICRRLEGLPLAVELAAARLKVVSPDALLERLDLRLPILTSGARDLPARQRTMRDTIAWSYDLLTPNEQRLFRHLAIFSDGCTLAALEAVASDPSDGADPILDALISLVDSSLLTPDLSRAGEPRYRMLETIRELGRELLQEHNEAEQIQERHATYFSAFAERAGADPMFLPGPTWLGEMDRDYSNIRNALDWLCRPETADAGLCLAAACGPFWRHQGYIREGRERFERILAIAPAQATPSTATALHWAGQLALAARDYAATETLGREELAVAQTLGDSHLTAAALHTLALVEQHRGNLDQAEPLFEQQLTIWRELGAMRCVAWVLVLHSGIAYVRGHLDQSRAMHAEALEHFRGIGDGRLIAATEAHLAVTALAQGELAEAARLSQTSLITQADVGERAGLVKPVVILAAVAAALGHFGLAAQLLGVADSMQVQTGGSLGPIDRPIADSAADKARRTLGADGFAAAYAIGRSMPRDGWLASADLVVAAAEQVSPDARDWPGSNLGLTRRESEVLQMLDGRTNREIAELLFVGPRTVDSHVSNLCAKLGVHSRREALARARALGVLPPGGGSTST